MSLEYTEIIEKTIALIYGSFDHKEWVERKKEQERLRRRDKDSRGWVMDNKWAKKMEIIETKGTAEQQSRKVWKKYYERRKKNEGK